MRFCLCDPVFSHFSRTPTCDRQTQGHSIYRASIAPHGKNIEDKPEVKVAGKINIHKHFHISAVYKNTQ